MSDVPAEPDTVFATEKEADAEAARLNRLLGDLGSPYFFVAAFKAQGQWRVERRGGPVPLKDALRHALRPWNWAWWPWSQ